MLQQSLLDRFGDKVHLFPNPNLNLSVDGPLMLLVKLLFRSEFDSFLGIFATLDEIRDASLFFVK